MLDNVGVILDEILTIILRITRARCTGHDKLIIIVVSHHHCP